MVLHWEIFFLLYLENFCHVLYSLLRHRLPFCHHRLNICSLVFHLILIAQTLKSLDFPSLTLLIRAERSISLASSQSLVLPLSAIPAKVISEDLLCSFQLSLNTLTSAEQKAIGQTNYSSYHRTQNVKLQNIIRQITTKKYRRGASNRAL